MCHCCVESKHAVPKVTPAGTEKGPYVTYDPPMILWHWAPRGWLLGRCPSLADCVRGAAGPERRGSVLVLPTLLRRSYRPSESPMEMMLSFPSPSNRCDFEAIGPHGTAAALPPGSC